MVIGTHGLPAVGRDHIGPVLPARLNLALPIIVAANVVASIVVAHTRRHACLRLLLRAANHITALIGVAVTIALRFLIAIPAPVLPLYGRQFPASLRAIGEIGSRISFRSIGSPTRTIAIGTPASSFLLTLPAPVRALDGR